MKTENKKIFLYDTSLRDGSQAEEVSLSLQDKLTIAEALDDFGIDYIEGGWPGSNPKDASFFKEIRNLTLHHSKIAAFGATAHPRNRPEDDPNIRLLLDAKTSVVTVVGKSSEFHVLNVLSVEKEKNLELIYDSIHYLKKNIDEVIFDAEHFFDGFIENPEYALSSIKAAVDAKVDSVTLCDTNGGRLHFEIEEIVKKVRQNFPDLSIGIHCHNDSDSAVANSLAAVLSGADLIQGTINGIGERSGNADLCSIIPNLQLKLGYSLVSEENLKKLRSLSLLVYEIANIARRPKQPYVGRSAFAHKGGIHVAAVRKVSSSYEHIDPERIGGKRRILVSDLSGKGNILTKSEEFGISLDGKDKKTKEILDKLKALENSGYQFEGAEASFELLMRRLLGEWESKFNILRARVVSNFGDINLSNWSEAVVKISMPDGSTSHAVAEGNGPVNALDMALRLSLKNYYPEINDVKLLDFKVRLVDAKSTTAATTRVLIESGDGYKRWGSVGVSNNVIEAAWLALVDSFEYKLHIKNGKKIQ